MCSNRPRSGSRCRSVRFTIEDCQINRTTPTFTVPADEDIGAFRAFLDANGYNEESLAALVGSASPPAPDTIAEALRRTREPTATNALARLFLIGETLDADLARDSLSGDFFDLCIRAGLAEVDGERLQATVVVVPVGGLLFASDAFRTLGTDRASGFVLPASAHAANYLRLLTMRTKVGRTLDLGCGCGIQALFAAQHSDEVVATDISEAAVHYTTFNAKLNGIGNVECVRGDFFEPIGDRTFDLIVCNPPFVPGPGHRFVYRDSPLELDLLGRQLLRDAPTHLEEGGHLQLLCESVEVAGKPWQERVEGWVRDTGCDAWILHHLPVAPAGYVKRRLRDVDTPAEPEAAAFDEWLGYFDAHDVTAIHPCLFVLRKRQGDNWAHVHNVMNEVVRPAGDAIAASIGTFDFLDRCSDDDALLAATLEVSPELKLEQQFGYADGAWRPERSVLRMDDALAMDAEVDMPVVAFLNQVDGRASLGDCIGQFAAQVGAPTEKVTADLLPIVRLFVGRGFLVPAAGD